jgi:transcription antitermination protein NusB
MYAAMEKRSAARELAFLVLFQLPQNTDKINIDKLAKTDFHAICLSAIRTLADFAKTNLKKSEASFIKSERTLLEYQLNHEENEGLSEATRSVPLPNTKETMDIIDNCYKAISLVRESLQIPELYWHYQDTDIQEFTLHLLMDYIQHKEDIQALIKETSQSWDISRMMKVDRKILEIAVTELNYSNIPNAVVASEAMKLSNKYSTEEGSKFINGILADIIKAVKD